MDLDINRRYIRSFPSEGTEQLLEGRKQAELSNTRYHYLRAAIQGNFRLTGDIPSSSTNGHFFPRCIIDFREYADFPLDQISGEKIHPGEDGLVGSAELEEYQTELTSDWKVVEGGILSCTGKARAFFNIMINYNSPSKTSGNSEMDAYFAQLKAEDFRKESIPCMVRLLPLMMTLRLLSSPFQFFGTRSGCLNPSCPFEHNEAKLRAARDRILEVRRQYMDAPHPKKVMDHRAQLRIEYLEESIGTPGDDEKAVDYDNPPRSLYCAYPSCSFTWAIPADGNIASTPLKICSGCKWTYYCSVSAEHSAETSVQMTIILQTKCQKDDWKRHKREPCKPLEQIIDDDSLWSPIGSRKGTEPFNIHWGNN